MNIYLGASRFPLLRHGFTVMELVIVVAVIGVLGSTAVAKYSDYSASARKTACISQQEQIALAARLAETESGALASDTVMRFRYDGTISQLRLFSAASAPSANYSVFVGQVPFSWGPTNTGTNITVRSRVDAATFLCPEDAKVLGAVKTPANLGPDGYNGISNITVQTGQIPGSVLGLYGGVTDQHTYTFAKNVLTARAAFSPVILPATSQIPPTSQDPLEGFNWMSQPIEYQNTSLLFCRRWGRRSNQQTSASLIAGLRSQPGDENFLPAQQTKLAHSKFAPNR